MSEFHSDHERARSFGAFADEYDRFRPAYAAALFDDLAALAPDGVLDIGCGSGALSVPLMERGVTVLGVDPDERMAERARRRGATVEVATFESWDDDGRRFDLLVCGAAWHWVDPSGGAAAAARVLRPGGRLVLCWNYEVAQEPAASALDEVYQRLAPRVTRQVIPPPDEWPGGRPLSDSPDFEDLGPHDYPYERTHTAASWVRMVSTFSDHRRLDPALSATLQQELTAAIESVGGSLKAQCGSFSLSSRRR